MEGTITIAEESPFPIERIKTFFLWVIKNNTEEKNRPFQLKGLRHFSFAIFLNFFVKNRPFQLKGLRHAMLGKISRVDGRIALSN